jgi:hypothetical protein
MPHKIDDLRDHLFATLQALRDPVKPMDVDRARAIAEVARVVVDTAKVEVQHMDLVGGRGSGFLPEPEAGPNVAQQRLLAMNGVKR